MKKLHQPFVLILMGVSGSGKTIVGERLSQALNLPFYDGDDFHPTANIEKMAQGIPLNDQDREPWLERLNRLIHRNLQNGQSLLLACSALKSAYRNHLARGNPNTLFIYLKGDFDIIYNRMKERYGHYMKASMLRSQFLTLQEPSNALVIDINQDIDTISKQIIHTLSTIDLLPVNGKGIDSSNNAIEHQ